MASNLLIVESPAKAKTLKKYLGADFEVYASYGHVRDLVPKQGAVDTEHEFAMKYELIDKNSKHVDSIAKAVKAAEHIYLATDPDREGEAIAWHLVEILKERKLLAKKQVQRVVFHEITPNAIREAVANPRELSMELVNAQQARRALDYLVGFNLSPLLWKKIRRGLSAGRVQSPALRLIVEREQEIRAFVAQEYWSVHFDSHKDKQKFTTRLVEFAGEKLEQFSIPDQAREEAILDAIRQASGDQAVVAKIDKKRKQRQAAAPFTTSTLQQESVRKLGLSTSQAMRLAQQLYEGIDIGGGSTGLITYMRTDSVALSVDAVTDIRAYIGDNFDKDYLPAKPVVYKTKAKNAQEAHEAIRPTAISRTPESVRAFLSKDQFRLYEMIWKRTLACQMAPAKFDTVSVDFTAGTGNTFRANGQTLVFPGFIAVYQENRDDDEESGNATLPPFAEGETVPMDKLYGDQHFTQPPPRYTEASLVKTLEEFGIGRPSTYASIISTLLDREYVLLEKKRFSPTDVGEVVNKFLTGHFTRYVDYDFTARLEDELDQISNGSREWQPVLETFWKDFHQLVTEKAGIARQEVVAEEMDEACPQCGKPLSVRLGRRGRFVGCTGYPECTYTRNLDGSKEEETEPVLVEGRNCPDCGSPLVLKTGRYGKFLGCSGYPQCKHIEPLEKPQDTGVTCPECKQGVLMQRKSRFGKIFYSCNRYPDCKYAVWNPPLAEPCPQCDWPILTLKTTKRRGTEKVCPQKECGYSEQIAPPEPKEAS